MVVFKNHQYFFSISFYKRWSIIIVSRRLNMFFERLPYKYNCVWLHCICSQDSLWSSGSEGKSTDPWIRLSESWLCYLSALWLWTSYLTSVCLGFVICKVEMEMALLIRLSRELNESVCFQYLEHCLGGGVSAPTPASEFR